MPAMPNRNDAEENNFNFSAESFALVFAIGSQMC